MTFVVCRVNVMVRSSALHETLLLIVNLLRLKQLFQRPVYASKNGYLVVLQTSCCPLRFCTQFEKFVTFPVFIVVYEYGMWHVLEPIMTVEVTAPEEFQGTVMGQLTKRNGIICGTDSNFGWFTVHAEV